VNRPVFQFETEHAAVIQFTTPSMDINIHYTVKENRRGVHDRQSLYFFF
jgi:hypothetical protein